MLSKKQRWSPLSLPCIRPCIWPLKCLTAKVRKTNKTRVTFKVYSYNIAIPNFQIFSFSLINRSIVLRTMERVGLQIGLYFMRRTMQINQLWTVKISNIRRQKFHFRRRNFDACVDLNIFPATVDVNAFCSLRKVFPARSTEIFIIIFFAAYVT